MHLLIYCAGGFGREVLDFARKMNGNYSRWEDITFIDDVMLAHAINGCDVRRSCEIPDIPEPKEFLIATGEPEHRERLYNELKGMGCRFATLIAGGATLLPNVTVGEGSIIMDSVLSDSVKVGCNCVINTRVIIGHDASFDDHCVISCKSFFGGGVQVGRKAFVGVGALVKERIKIGERARVGGGAVVLRNVPREAIVSGNPAKRIGMNETRRVFGL